MNQILHRVFGIIVLRGEPGSTNLQPRMHSGFMDPLPTLTTGDEGDISNLCQYGWYEWYYFRDQTAAFPTVW